MKEIDRDVEITYNLDKSLKQLKSGAQILLNYLNEGNALSGVSFSFKKKFLSKEIKERLESVDNIRVNGSPCDTIEEFNTVIRDIELQQDFDELSEIWDSKFPQGNSYFNKFIFFKNIGSEITKLISYIDQAEEICSKIEGCSALNISPFGIEDINDLIGDVDYNYDLNKEKSFKKFIEKAESHLTHNNIHPIVEKIIKNLKDIDWYSYDTTLNELKSFAKKKVNYQKFKQLESSLHDVFPDLIESIKSDCVTFSELSKFNKAIYFKHAQNEINRLMDVDEKLLFKDLQELEKKEKNLVAKIASKKAWSIVVERLKENRSLRQQLNAWAMAVEKIGITGKGKKAMKFRKIAQQEMEHCKDSVPCWIMPLYKVAETIRPEQEMYDYVIIDEASQLGPDAIFLLYIAKNIIIVGDDKQTSPEYVGVDTNTMTPYIERHLKDIPFSDYYGPEFSFFDHAKLFCDGVTVLREHFRCMPEIIEFSNKYFYAPDGKGLYPLKQYSENRLRPLECV
ncbi:MAG: hypothetical protein KAR45_11365, partial [Desulfobacteraceae bacterium]|nr:hypothetical protein [Desulfobacteraceae bacterium]